MDNIARIRAELKRRREDILSKVHHLPIHRIELLDDLLSFLDTLSEEPDRSLEEAAEEYSEGIIGREDAFMCKAAFIAGAEWQARQLLQGSPMPEDTVLFQKGVAEGRRLMMEDAVEGEVIVPIYEGDDTWSAEIKIPGRYEIGQKVRIIVVKADEE